MKVVDVGDGKVLGRLREICLALPDTKETLTWGHPNFRVGEKIFCSFGADHGDLAISLKVGKDVQGAFLDDPRFFKTPYVGNHGWVSLRVEAAELNWEEIRELVHLSYSLIAPARTRRASGGKSRTG